MSVVNVGPLIVNAEATYRCVSGVVIEVRGADLRDLAPGCEFLRSNVVPLLAAVARLPDQSVISTGPERVDILERRGERINYSALFGRSFGDESAHAGRCSGILAGEIGTDGLPGISAVDGFEKHVAGVVKSVGIERREHGGRGAVGAVLCTAQRDGRNVLHLAGGPVKL